MSLANGLFANPGWVNSPQDIEFASQGAFRFRELKAELRDLLGCLYKPDYKGDFRDDVIESRTLVDTGVAPGVYNKVTVNSKGQVVSAELTDPLGDPIHSPGGNGFVDCGDIATPDAIYKGFTRVQIDPFGRVTKGDCVSPHVLVLSQTYDTIQVDQHGRVTSGVDNDLANRVSDGEDAIADLEAALSAPVLSQGSLTGAGLSGTPASIATITLTLPAGKTWTRVRVYATVQLTSSTDAAFSSVKAGAIVQSGFTNLPVAHSYATGNSDDIAVLNLVFEFIPTTPTVSLTLGVFFTGSGGDLTAGRAAYAVGQCI